MLTTKRYEYLNISKIRIHPTLTNHRPLSQQKVSHYEEDILRNGLLEPLITWEKNRDEYYIVGGFHRYAAIHKIREKNQGYFDHIDVRVVAGDIDEMKALNLKLNADRLDTRITEYFDTVIYLNNANWSKERIADFLDKSVSWIDDLIRYVPIMDSRIRNMLDEGSISWNRAKGICRAVKNAEAGKEKEVLERELELLTKEKNNEKHRRKPLSLKSLKKRLETQVQKHSEKTYTIGAEDLLSLVLVLDGKSYDERHIFRVRKSFPGLLE